MLRMQCVSLNLGPLGLSLLGEGVVGVLKLKLNITKRHERDGPLWTLV